MFDLEQSVSDWRRQMLAAGIRTPVPLDELETHLREDIEQQMLWDQTPNRHLKSQLRKVFQAAR